MTRVDQRDFGGIALRLRSSELCHQQTRGGVDGNLYWGA
jgi:hypothetical protein